MTAIRDACTTLLLDIVADLAIASICLVGVLALAMDRLEESLALFDAEWM